jgi:hypothetical protein
MRLEDWKYLIDGVFAAHGKAVPAERIVGKWFEHVGEIPMEAGEPIAKKLEQATKLEPNFGAQFLAEWWRWRAQNQDRCADEDDRPHGCQYCERGTIYFVHVSAARVHVSPCGYCRAEVRGALTLKTAMGHGLSYPEPRSDGYRIGNGIDANNHVLRILRERRQAA